MGETRRKEVGRERREGETHDIKGIKYRKKSMLLSVTAPTVIAVA